MQCAIVACGIGANVVRICVIMFTRNQNLHENNVEGEMAGLQWSDVSKHSFKQVDTQTCDRQTADEYKSIQVV